MYMFIKQRKRSQTVFRQRLSDICQLVTLFVFYKQRHCCDSYTMCSFRHTRLVWCTQLNFLRQSWYYLFKSIFEWYLLCLGLFDGVDGVCLLCFLTSKPKLQLKENVVYLI
jgi:hypothetical protein